MAYTTHRSTGHSLRRPSRRWPAEPLEQLLLARFDQVAHRLNPQRDDLIACGRMMTGEIDRHQIGEYGAPHLGAVIFEQRLYAPRQSERVDCGGRGGLVSHYHTFMFHYVYATVTWPVRPYVEVAMELKFCNRWQALRCSQPHLEPQMRFSRHA